MAVRNSGKYRNVTVQVRRVREEPGNDEGRRVLVDRVWPRGVAKASLGHDEWCQDVAPTKDLRQWYGHEPERFAEFRRRYLEELESEPAAGALEELRSVAADGTLTLLTATRDVEHSHARVLADVLADPSS